jgi:hypothetical protein
MHFIFDLDLGMVIQYMTMSGENRRDIYNDVHSLADLNKSRFKQEMNIFASHKQRPSYILLPATAVNLTHSTPASPFRFLQCRLLNLTMEKI